MRRAFTLQLHDVPPGRAFTCPTCNAASFHPSNVLQVACKACSPFLEVKTEEGQTSAVCRWATGGIVIFDLTEAMAWCMGNLAPAPLPDMPPVVRDSLQQHFETSNYPIRIVPP